MLRLAAGAATMTKTATITHLGKRLGTSDGNRLDGAKSPEKANSPRVNR
jgi:hypothetical protein